MSPYFASHLTVMRLLYASGLLILAIQAWRRGWRRPLLVAVVIGITASLAVEFLPALSGDPRAIEGGSAVIGLIELVSLVVRWLSMLALVAMVGSRRAEPEANAEKQI